MEVISPRMGVWKAFGVSVLIVAGWVVFYYVSEWLNKKWVNNDED